MNNNSGANGYATIITFEDGSICNSIGKNAFANLFNLKEINYGIVSYTGTLDSASNIFGGDMTGSNNNGESGVKIRISDSVKTLPNYLFYNLTQADQIEFAAINMNNFTGAHSIFYRFGVSMFSLDDVTVKVVIKKNVSHIPNYLFATQGVNCIEEIYFESDTKCATIGSYAFADLGELKTVSLANGVETIGSYAFASNNLTNQIEELVLPETVNTISSYAFNKCTSLKKIYIASKNLYAIYEFAFNDCWNNLKIGFNGTNEDISDALKQYWNCFYNNGDPDPMYLEHTSYFFGISLDQFNELVDELLG